MSRAELLKELKELAGPALKKDPKDRTYRDRYYIWEYEQMLHPSNRIEDYNEGEEINIWDGTKLANNEIKDGFGNDFPEWFRSCGKHFGKLVRNRDNGKIYTLVGMSYTYRDYYYILESEGIRTYATCLSSIKFLL